MNLSTNKASHHTPMEFGLAANGAGVAAGTFTKKAIGSMEGPGTPTYAVIGNIPTEATGGIEGTGINIVAVFSGSSSLQIYTCYCYY